MAEDLGQGVKPWGRCQYGSAPPYFSIKHNPTMRNVTGIDWLSFSGYFKPECEMQAHSANFLAEQRDYHTRNFSEVWDIYYNMTSGAANCRHRAKFGTICCKPQSPILSDRLVSFKLENDLLYTEHWFLMLLTFIDDFNLQDVKISRVDLYRDFQYLDTPGLPETPREFIQEIAAGKLKKKGGSKYSIYADDEDGGAYAVTYGSILSGRQLAIYNKTKELKEVKDKPYIRKTWADAGFDKKFPVYRAEVRICKRGLELFDLECQDKAKLNLKHIYEFSIAPIIDGYFSAVAMWTDSESKYYNPLTITRSDDTLFPFIPKFKAGIKNPNPHAQAKNVLKWAQDVRDEVKERNFEGTWYDKTLAILNDFIWLVQSTIPIEKKSTKFYRDDEYFRWLTENAKFIKRYRREHTAPLIPLEFFDEQNLPF